MATVTMAAIRDALIARVAAQVPAIGARDRFVVWREDDDFRAWAAANAAACLRRFTVVTVGETTEPSVSSTLYERVNETLEIVVAYQDTQRQTNRRGLDDLIASDMHLLTYRAGTSGCSIDPLIQGGALTVMSRANRRERAYEGVVFGVIPLEVSYVRSRP